MSRILVTGASGFLGSWMTRSLVEKGFRVRVLARPSSDLSELKGWDFEMAEGDITAPETLAPALNGVEAVFHFAGLIAYTRSQRSLMEKINVGGTQNVLDACQKASVSRLIHVSSVVTIGASPDGRNLLNETSPFNLTEYNLGYPETKRAAEHLVLQAVAQNQIDAVVVNPATVYGAGDARKGSRRTQLKVARGKFPFFTSGGVNVVAVEDVVEATFQAWRTGRKGERYILGGENVTLKDLFFMIAEAAEVPPPRLFLPKAGVLAFGQIGDWLENIGRKGPINSENALLSTLYHWYDSSKAQRELKLGRTSAKEAISRSVSWMRSNGLICT